MNCLNCEKETKNPKFCSRSCAASYNNKMQIAPKRIPIKRFCKYCGKEIPLKRSEFTGLIIPRLTCNDCNRNHVDWENVSKKDLQSLRSYQISSRIRNLAGAIYKRSNKPKYCVNCGYTKHYEVCHIKAIKSFDDDVKISVINSLDNLIALCPNCHWEFDNNLLKL